MKDKQTELELFAVQEDAKLDREIRSRWQWVEPSVWTERMLTALEKGVKGGKWFILIDKVYSMDNLHAASAKVIQNRGSAGVDNQTVEMYETNRNEYNQKMHQILKDDEYKPKGIKRVWIPKPGKKQEKRPLGIPAVRDRLVQTALRNVIEPIFEKDFAEHSYGFRPGRGCKQAVSQFIFNQFLITVDYYWSLRAKRSNLN